MTRANYRYECSHCHLSHAVLAPYDIEDACSECSGILTRHLLCPCGNDAFDGVESCLQCEADYTVEHPSHLAECTRALQVAIGEEFARRLKSVMTRRQAA
jgi:hypothetical protein